MAEFYVFQAKKIRKTRKITINYNVEPNQCKRKANNSFP